MRRLHSVYALALVLLLAGCVTAPKTPAQRLGYIEGKFVALVESASDMRDAGILTPEQAERIDPAIQRGNQMLDAAWQALGEGNDGEVLSYLGVVNQLMLEINAELREARNGSS